MTEAERKRRLALEAAGGRVVTSRPADVRWLLCGRGRPVSATAPQSPYTVVLEDGRAQVLFQDIETSRVEAEEGFDGLGYELVPYPWHEGHGLEETPPVLDYLRLELGEEERERYRTAGRAAAAAMAATLAELRSDLAELDAAGELAFRLQRDGFTTPVVLVGGESRQAVHRHPLPTGEKLGKHALLAFTAERDGLHVSMTRIVSFGRPPAELEQLMRAAAEVDAAYLNASHPGATLGEVLAAGRRAYSRLGRPDEWRRHHQGGLTGYAGREVFAVPDEPTRIPRVAAVAWNPSIAGGAKSEDTAIVDDNGVEMLTATPELPELDVDGLRRSGIAEL